MAGFSNQSFDARFGAMGDEAEGVFEHVYEKGFVRWGLNRPSIQVSALAMKIRYAPDYLTTNGFVEVMGVGRDQTLKLKVEKLLCLWQWNHEMPTQLFIWDSKNQRYCYVSIPDLANQLGIATMATFPEGKNYWQIPISKLAAEWTTMQFTPATST